MPTGAQYISAIKRDASDQARRLANLEQLATYGRIQRVDDSPTRDLGPLGTALDIALRPYYGVTGAVGEAIGPEVSGFESAAMHVPVAGPLAMIATDPFAAARGAYKGFMGGSQALPENRQTFYDLAELAGVRSGVKIPRGPVASLGGAGMGAAIGSAFGPIGTGVGALAGGLLGDPVLGGADVLTGAVSLPSEVVLDPLTYVAPPAGKTARGTQATRAVKAAKRAAKAAKVSREGVKHLNVFKRAWGSLKAGSKQKYLKDFRELYKALPDGELKTGLKKVSRQITAGKGGPEAAMKTIEKLPGVPKSLLSSLAKGDIETISKEIGAGLRRKPSEIIVYPLTDKPVKIKPLFEMAKDVGESTGARIATARKIMDDNPGKKFKQALKEADEQLSKGIYAGPIRKSKEIVSKIKNLFTKEGKEKSSKEYFESLYEISEEGEIQYTPHDVADMNRAVAIQTKDRIEQLRADLMEKNIREMEPIKFTQEEMAHPVLRTQEEIRRLDPMIARAEEKANRQVMATLYRIIPFAGPTQKISGEKASEIYQYFGDPGNLQKLKNAMYDRMLPGEEITDRALREIGMISGDRNIYNFLKDRKVARAFRTAWNHVVSLGDEGPSSVESVMDILSARVEGRDVESAIKRLSGAIIRADVPKGHLGNLPPGSVSTSLLNDIGLIDPERKVIKPKKSFPIPTKDATGKRFVKERMAKNMNDNVLDLHYKKLKTITMVQQAKRYLEEIAATMLPYYMQNASTSVRSGAVKLNKMLKDAGIIDVISTKEMRERGLASRVISNYTPKESFNMFRKSIDMIGETFTGPMQKSLNKYKKYLDGITSEDEMLKAIDDWHWSTLSVLKRNSTSINKKAILDFDPDDIIHNTLIGMDVSGTRAGMIREEDIFDESFFSKWSDWFERKQVVHAEEPTLRLEPTVRYAEGQKEILSSGEPSYAASIAAQYDLPVARVTEGLEEIGESGLVPTEKEADRLIQETLLAGDESYQAAYNQTQEISAELNAVRDRFKRWLKHFREGKPLGKANNEEISYLKSDVAGLKEAEEKLRKNISEMWNEYLQWRGETFGQRFERRMRLREEGGKPEDMSDLVGRINDTQKRLTKVKTKRAELEVDLEDALVRRTVTPNQAARMIIKDKKRIQDLSDDLFMSQLEEVGFRQGAEPGIAGMLRLKFEDLDPHLLSLDREIRASMSVRRSLENKRDSILKAGEVVPPHLNRNIAAANKHLNLMKTSKRKYLDGLSNGREYFSAWADEAAKAARAVADEALDRVPNRKVSDKGKLIPTKPVSAESPIVPPAKHAPKTKPTPKQQPLFPDEAEGFLVKKRKLPKNKMGAIDFNTKEIIIDTREIAKRWNTAKDTIDYRAGDFRVSIPKSSFKNADEFGRLVYEHEVAHYALSQGAYDLEISKLTRDAAHDYDFIKEVLSTQKALEAMGKGDTVMTTVIKGRKMPIDEILGDMKIASRKTFRNDSVVNERVFDNTMDFISNLNPFKVWDRIKKSDITIAGFLRDPQRVMKRLTMKKWESDIEIGKRIRTKADQAYKALDKAGVKHNSPDSASIWAAINTGRVNELPNKLRPAAAAVKDFYDQAIKDSIKSYDKTRSFFFKGDVPTKKGKELFKFFNPERDIGFYDDWVTRRIGKRPQARKDYITHYHDMADTLQVIDPEMDPELYSKYFLPREGERLSGDVIEALEAYFPGTHRYISNMPTINQLEYDARRFLEDGMPNRAKYALWRARQLKGHIGWSDRVVKNMLTKYMPKTYKKHKLLLRNRPLTAMANGFTRLAFLGIIGGNVGLAIRNATQNMNTLATYGVFGPAKAAKAMLQKENRRLVRELIDAEDMHGVMARVNPRVGGLYSKIEDYAYMPFNAAEMANRGVALFSGAFRRMAEKGMKADMDTLRALRAKGGKDWKDVLESAREAVRLTQFVYDVSGRSPVFHTPFGRIGGQFTNFTIKQGEFVVNDLAKMKSFLKMMRNSDMADRFGFENAIDVKDYRKAIKTKAPILHLMLMGGAFSYMMDQAGLQFQNPTTEWTRFPMSPGGRIMGDILSGDMKKLVADTTSIVPGVQAKKLYNHLYKYPTMRDNKMSTKKDIILALNLYPS